MEYDFIKMGEKDVDWVKSLPTYQRILNKDPKEVLSHKTPFEVYFARKCKSFKTSVADNELVDNTGRINPTATDRKRRCRHVSGLRQEARKVTNRCDVYADECRELNYDQILLQGIVLERLLFVCQERYRRSVMSSRPK